MGVFHLRPSLRFWNGQVLQPSLSALFGTLVFLPKSVFCFSWEASWGKSLTLDQLEKG